MDTDSAKVTTLASTIPVVWAVGHHGAVTHLLLLVVVYHAARVCK